LAYKLAGSAVVVMKRQRRLAVIVGTMCASIGAPGASSGARCPAIMPVMAVRMVTMRMVTMQDVLMRTVTVHSVTMQKPAIEMVAVQIVVMQQAAGRRGQ
jgi:hypothetical protein